MLNNLVLVSFNCTTYLYGHNIHTNLTIRQEVLPKHLLYLPSNEVIPLWVEGKESLYELKEKKDITK